MRFTVAKKETHKISRKEHFFWVALRLSEISVKIQQLFLPGKVSLELREKRDGARWITALQVLQLAMECSWSVLSCSGRRWGLGAVTPLALTWSPLRGAHTAARRSGQFYSGLGRATVNREHGWKLPVGPHGTGSGFTVSSGVSRSLDVLRTLRFCKAAL